MTTWSTEQQERLAFESALLKKEIPHFYWENHTDSSSTCVKGEYCSSAGNSYMLGVWLGPDYPHNVPNMRVLSPCPLYGYLGKEITSYGVSHDMHTNSPFGNYVEICHWKSDHWSASYTIVAVLMKGFLWIEALEVHRRTGKGINAYSLSFS